MTTAHIGKNQNVDIPKYLHIEMVKIGVNDNSEAVSNNITMQER
jgi:hypothetical protein